MRILEVILEGFKSYPNRTVLRNFDHSFNAITGQNGSGKSNFLDAIIFVLGISKNLSLLRITKLSELIYQNAMGKISKAEVTVVFDNSDSTNQPIGYEDCVTITATRIIQGDKSKFYVNGKTSKLKDFKEMFKQVKLSIETPSFIVTQGRIAKIITLKPMELLDMIEDTVGTLLFKLKKIEVNKGIDREMDQFMEHGQRIIKKVGPRLVKIRNDITKKAKIDRIGFQITKLEKKIVAVGVEFHNLKIKDMLFEQQKFTLKLEQSQQQETFLMELQSSYEKKIEQKYSQQEKLQQLQEYQEQTDQEQKEFERLQIKYQNISNDLTKYEDLYKEKLEKKTNLISEIKSGQYQFPKFDEQIAELEENIRSKREDKDRIQYSGFQNQKQLIVVNIATITQEIKQINNKLKQLKSKVLSQKDDLKQRQQDSTHSKDEIAQKKKIIEQNQNKKQELLSKIVNIKDIENKLKTLNNKLTNQTHELRMLILEKDQPEFSYFNISEQAKQILPQKFEFETLATRCRFKQQLFEQYKYVINESMGALGIVICETTEQANILCQHSFQLFNNRSVTIQTKADFNNQQGMNQQLEEQIRKEARDQRQKLVFLWELLDIDPRYKKFFDKQFQNQVIIENLKERDFGKYLASHYYLKVYNPEGDQISDGIASGGYKGDNQARTKNADVIQKFHTILEKIENLRVSIQSLKNEQEELTRNQQLQINYQTQLQEVNKTIEKAKVEIERTEKQLSEEAINLLKDDIKSLEQQENVFNLKLKDCEKKQQEYSVQLENCQEGQKVDKDYQVQQMKTIELELDDLKKQLEKQNKAKDQVDDKIIMNERALKDLEEQIMKIEANKREIRQNFEGFQKLLKEKQQLLEERAQQQYDQKEQLEAYEDINIELLQEQINKLQIDIKQLQQKRPAIIKEIKQFDEEIKLNKSQIQQIKQLPLYQQIQIEMGLGKYKINIEEGLSKFEDYKDQILTFKKDIKNLQKQLNYKKLSEKQIQLSETFDKIGKEIKLVFTTANQLRQELEDCESIREFAVRRCVAKVSDDFKMIFKTLYPYATAELKGIGENYTEKGLEVIIKMEGKQKPLSQLSGGQKSLLAVALLMAQLRYFPSPFYLLDEIDSALDIEHTEKLGLIFATHFKTAQFILISLKSQMFKSAPVIFNVSQTAGVSLIQREEGRKDEAALQKQLKGYNINMEEHQQIEQKRLQQAEQFKQAKQRKNKLKKDTEQYEEEQAKEDQLDNQPHWVRFSKSKKYLEAKQKLDKARKNETVYKPVNQKLVEDFLKLDAECYIRMKYKTEEEFLRIPQKELEEMIDKTIHFNKLVMDEEYFDKKVAEWQAFRAQLIKEKTLILTGKIMDIPDKLNTEERKQFFKDKAKKHKEPHQYLYEQRKKKGAELEKLWSPVEKRKRRTKKKQTKKAQRQQSISSDSDFD